MPFGLLFRQDCFMFLPILAYVKHVTPGTGRFWTQGAYLIYLGRGLLSDAAYQTSRLYRPCGFRQEDFLKFSSQNFIFRLCDLDMQLTIIILIII